jgi:hypothetical protein
MCVYVHICTYIYASTATSSNSFSHVSQLGVLVVVFFELTPKLVRVHNNHTSRKEYVVLVSTSVAFMTEHPAINFLQQS